MTYQPWFYLIAFAFWVGLGVLIGFARVGQQVFGDGASALERSPPSAPYYSGPFPLSMR